MPLIIPLAYFLLLPHSLSFLYSVTPTVYEDTLSPPPSLSALPYTPIALDEDKDKEEGTHALGPKRGVSLNANDKWRLVRPLLLKYMLPLCRHLFFLVLHNCRSMDVYLVCVYLVSFICPLYSLELSFDTCVGLSTPSIRSVCTPRH